MKLILILVCICMIVTGMVMKYKYNNKVSKYFINTGTVIIILLLLDTFG